MFVYTGTMHSGGEITVTVKESAESREVALAGYYGHEYEYEARYHGSLLHVLSHCVHSERATVRVEYLDGTVAEFSGALAVADRETYKEYRAAVATGDARLAGLKANRSAMARSALVSAVTARRREVA